MERKNKILIGFGLAAIVAYFVFKKPNGVYLNASGNDFVNADGDVSLPTIATLPVTEQEPAVTKRLGACVGCGYFPQSGGTLTGDGGAEIIEKGLVWNTAINPNISHTKKVDKGDSDDFTMVIDKLLPNVTYYVRAFATNSKGTGYGNQVSYRKALNLPTVSTLNVNGETRQSDNSYIISTGADVKDLGGLPSILKRGVVWSDKLTYPTIEDNVTVEEDKAAFDGHFLSASGVAKKSYGIGASIVNIQVPIDKTINIRAFATSNIGTAYGANVVWKKVSKAPTLSTTAAYYISSNSAITGGNISVDGGLNITESGIVYSKTSLAIIANSNFEKIVGEQDVQNGVFTVNIDDLEPATLYYIRSYAKNDTGIGYGNQLYFRTLK